jgi:hypothetical protein
MPNGRDAVAADSEAGSVHLIRDLASAPSGIILAVNLAGIVEVQPVADGSMILVAQPEDKTVSMVDSGSGAVQSVPMDVAPVGLRQLSNRDAFLVSWKPGEPGWIFFRTGGRGLSVLIPATPKPAEALQ